MRYWVYINGEVPGSYEPDELAATPGFTETSMVCPAAGGIEERHWRHAGQLPEILDALRRRVAAERPLPPEAPEAEAPGAAEPGMAKGPNDILSDSSNRLFRHVSELMKELENRRAERALTQSLQRQIVELNNELLAMRERNAYLQERADLIAGFQDREKKLQDNLTRMRSDAAQRERKIDELEGLIVELRRELEETHRGEASVSRGLERQTRVCDDLTKELADKEFTLAKSFGVIRRLEELLGDMLPASVAGIARGVPGLPATIETPEPEPPREEAAAAEPAHEAAALPGASNEGMCPPAEDVGPPEPRTADPIEAPAVPARETAPEPATPGDRPVDGGAPAPEAGRGQAEEPCPVHEERESEVVGEATGPGSGRAEDHMSAPEEVSPRPTGESRPAEEYVPVPAPWRTAVNRLTDLMSRYLSPRPPSFKPKDRGEEPLEPPAPPRPLTPEEKKD
ncbi:MAG: hypothetical protein ABII00_16865 [Elusimicrobiota bacterium]